MKILGIAGSLRRASYNRALVEAARGLTPDGMAIEVFSTWTVSGRTKSSG